MSYIEDYYNSYDEDGRLLSRHGQVENLTTVKYIRECLAGVSEPKILETGAVFLPKNRLQRVRRAAASRRAARDDFYKGFGVILRLYGIKNLWGKHELH